MNFWDRITGNDMRRAYKALQGRAKKLPPAHQAAWAEIQEQMESYSDITGRNLIPMLTGMLSLLEESAADGQCVQETLGTDIDAFCAAVANEEGAKTCRDKWRAQLNKAVMEKRNKLGG